MSSFVIDKKSYITAGGFIAGLTEIPGHSEALFLYNYSEGRQYTAEDFRLAFDWLYRLNLKSVQLQYPDWKQEYNKDEFKDEFNDAKKMARDIYRYNPGEFRRQVDRLNLFFSSILYQIEDQGCEQKAKGFIYRLNFALNASVRCRCYEDDFTELDSYGEFAI